MGKQITGDQIVSYLKEHQKELTAQLEKINKALSAFGVEEKMTAVKLKTTATTQKGKSKNASPAIPVKATTKTLAAKATPAKAAAKAAPVKATTARAAKAAVPASSAKAVPAKVTAPKAAPVKQAPVAAEKPVIKKRRARRIKKA